MRIQGLTAIDNRQLSPNSDGNADPGLTAIDNRQLSPNSDGNADPGLTAIDNRQLSSNSDICEPSPRTAFVRCQSCTSDVPD
jgi:hypothetical protein